eukprot:COSAG05_NODE_13664_length_422_cov_0.613003_1_plen_63_part_01
MYHTLQPTGVGRRAHSQGLSERKIISNHGDKIGHIRFALVSPQKFYCRYRAQTASKAGREVPA